MKVYAIRQQIGSDNERITGIFTDEEQAKKYAKKSFKDYGDWRNLIEVYELDKYYEDVITSPDRPERLDWRIKKGELK